MDLEYDNSLNKNLIEGVDFYYNEDGYKVFTEAYHLKRGYCCQNGCKHCPYGNSHSRRDK
jgi:hypothetical protein